RTAGDRGTHLGERKKQSRVVERGFGAGYAGFLLVESTQALIELLAGHGAGVLELLDAGGFQAGQRPLRLRKLEPRFGAVVVRLVGAGVDEDEDVVLLDELSFVEQHLVDVTGGARAQLYGINRLEPPCKLIPVLDALAD